MNEYFTAEQVVELMRKFDKDANYKVGKTEASLGSCRDENGRLRDKIKDLKKLLNKKAPKTLASYEELNRYSSTYDNDRKKLGL